MQTGTHPNPTLTITHSCTNCTHRDDDFSVSIHALGFYVPMLLYIYLLFMKVYFTIHQTFITPLSRRGSQRQVTEMGEYIFKVSFIFLVVGLSKTYYKGIFSGVHIDVIMNWSCLCVGWFDANWRERLEKMQNKFEMRTNPIFWWRCQLLSRIAHDIFHILWSDIDRYCHD